MRGDEIVFSFNATFDPEHQDQDDIRVRARRELAVTAANENYGLFGPMFVKVEPDASLEGAMHFHASCLGRELR